MAGSLQTRTNVVPIDAEPMRVLARFDVGTLSGAATKKKESETRFTAEEITFRTGTAGREIPFASTIARLTQSELYPVRHAFSPEHITALRLLGLAVSRTKRALEALTGGDPIRADSETQKVQVLLPELFCCRTLGDGFGTVINGVMSAFETLAGNALDAHQLRTLTRIFSTLRDKPFMGADEAEEQLELLESANLNPYPPELVEFLSSAEGVR